MADHHGGHRTGGAWVISTTEDYCLSPAAPVGYMLFQLLEVSTLLESSVRILGTPCFNLKSRVACVTGNEAGVGGGVVSGVNLGMCRPIQKYANKVRAKGEPVICDGTVMEMNCAGPDGPANTVGKVYYTSAAGNGGGDERHQDTGSHSKKEGLPTRPNRKPDLEVDGPGGTKIPVYKTDEFGPFESASSQAGEYVGKGPGSPFILLNEGLPAHQVGEEIQHELSHAADDYANGPYFADKRGLPKFDHDAGDPFQSEINAQRKEIEAIKNNKEAYPDEEAYRKRLDEEEQKLDALETKKHKGNIDRGFHIIRQCRQLRGWERRTGEESPHGEKCEEILDELDL